MTDQLHLNRDLPYIMHIDLNSCFAIIEQQANRLLRGKPVGVAAYDTPRGFVLAASYEAKAKGVKLGVNVEQARSMAPGIVIMTPDPAKYRQAHQVFKEILLEYTPDVRPKSIDEFILDFTHSRMLRSRKESAANDNKSKRAIHNNAMKNIGNEIKQRIRGRLGEWVTVNVGISTNRFLAKYAAGFGKPDGMTLIDHTNLEHYYRCAKGHTCIGMGSDCKQMVLIDLPGINTRYRARLRSAGIYTPSDFLQADLRTLKKQVFKSINGLHWYMRLRGHEVGADTIEFDRKSIGHQYALSNKTTDIGELERLLMKLCEKTGRRLRKHDYCAYGIHLHLAFAAPRDDPFNPYGAGEGPRAGFNLHDFRSWSQGEKLGYRLYTTQDIYKAAQRLLHQASIPGDVRAMSVHVFALQPWDPEQLSLFGEYEKWNMDYGDNGSEKGRIQTIDKGVRTLDSEKRLSDAVDALNNRYGEFVITPALMLEMQGEILDRIAFGSIKDYI